MDLGVSLYGHLALYGNYSDLALGRQRRLCHVGNRVAMNCFPLLSMEILRRSE
jgi:hypothetical protein